MSATTTDDHIHWIGPADEPTGARFHVLGTRIPGVLVEGGAFARIMLAVRIVLRRPVRLEMGPGFVEIKLKEPR